MKPVKPVLLVIEDGWGIRENENANSVTHGHTPNFDKWQNTLERAIVHTSGEHVGLTPNQMGNSEVGHLNLGAGRIVYQDISRINIAIEDGSLAQDEKLLSMLRYARENHKKVHLVGLLGTGGVHSHQDHLNALLRITKVNDVNTVIHVITDGRDTPTEAGIEFLAILESYMQELEHGKIATVSGRYYAMDRDKRWHRTQLAYDAMCFGQGNHASSADVALKESYAKGITDEFVVPTVIAHNENLLIENGDVVICYNFRADRMRQLSQAFALEAPEGFEGHPVVSNLKVITFTEYLPDMATVLFPKHLLNNTLAEWLSKHDKKQYHSAETEKYPHVTFFFNGRREEPWNLEERLIVPSPKVATYDLKPEMSAYELTEATLNRLKNHDDDFLVINFANPDMVGHTGSLEAATRAVEVVDECVGRLVEAVLAKDGVVIITADHGNCEMMVDQVTGEPHTYHTVGPVSLFVIGKSDFYELYTWGRLADVAPTVLDLLGLPKPAEMTGNTLIKRVRQGELPAPTHL